jgi:hypothetical protein
MTREQQRRVVTHRYRVVPHAKFYDLWETRGVSSNSFDRAENMNHVTVAAIRTGPSRDRTRRLAGGMSYEERQFVSYTRRRLMSSSPSSRATSASGSGEAGHDH